MKKIALLAVAAGIILSACGPDEPAERTGQEANGGVYYGGVFRMNELEDFKSLYPLAITEVVSHRIANQVYEGLVKLDQNDLTIVPGIAYKWEHNDDLTKWTFHLRNNAKFHNDPCFADGKGRAVKAADVKFCLDKLCEESEENSAFEITFKDRVKGATEYYNASREKKLLPGGVEGIKAIDDSTLAIDLNFPFAGFLNILSTPGGYVYPKEAFDKYGKGMREKCVGTGPFQVKNIKRGDVVILEKNKEYWNVDEFGNRLPYMDMVKFTFIKEKKSEMLDFKRGNLEMIFRLPIEMIPEIMGDLEHAKDRKVDFEIQSVPALSIYYNGMLCTGGVFEKKEVRLAFNYAIDRQKLVDYTLQGEGIPGMYGVVPPVEAFEQHGYNFKNLKGYTFDKGLAKEYLAKAGYPNGKNFPKVTLHINSAGGERNIQIAEVIQKSLKENLNVDIDINTVPFAEHIDAYQSGKVEFFRTGWSADYPDPETFLVLLYGKLVPKNPGEKSFTNTTRYVNPKFDSLFAMAQREPDISKRYEMLRQADQIGLDDGAIMPLFYEENYRLVQLNVRNFPANGMEYRDLTKVYLVPKDKMTKPKK
jgi:oligopeptide transport system substrate-binding protein